MRAFSREGVDYLGEVEQALVYAKPLFDPCVLLQVSRVHVITDFLTACEVDEIQVAFLFQKCFGVFSPCGLSDFQSEKSVRSTRAVVQLGGGEVAILLSKLEKGNDLLNGADLDLIGSLDDELFVLIFMNTQSLVFESAPVVSEQIVDSFVVNFNVGKFYLKAEHSLLFLGVKGTGS